MGEKGAKPDLSGDDLTIAVVVSRFNEDVSQRLLRGALAALEEHGVEDPDVYWVPGSLELPVTALALAEKGGHDAKESATIYFAIPPGDRLGKHVEKRLHKPLQRDLKEWLHAWLKQHAPGSDP